MRASRSTSSTSAVAACLAGLLLLSMGGCAGLAPSWTSGVSGADIAWEGPAPERVSVGGLVMRGRSSDNRMVREAFMKELRLLGLVQDEGNMDLVFVGDVTMSPAHEPLGGHDIYLTLSAYLPGTATEVWWCRVYREYDVYKRTREELQAVLAKAAEMFQKRFAHWGGK
jgi:hypothetical protein